MELSKKLESLDFSEEIDQYRAYSESKEIKLDHCPHKNTTVMSGKLRCSCGASWYGSTQQLLELKKHLDLQTF